MHAPGKLLESRRVWPLRCAAKSKTLVHAHSVTFHVGLVCNVVALRETSCCWYQCSTLYSQTDSVRMSLMTQPAKVEPCHVQLIEKVVGLL